MCVILSDMHLKQENSKRMSKKCTRQVKAKRKQASRVEILSINKINLKTN